MALTTAEKAYIVDVEYYSWPNGPKCPGWAKLITLLTVLHFQDYFHKNPPSDEVNVENFEDQVVFCQSGSAIQVTQLLFV